MKDLRKHTALWILLLISVATNITSCAQLEITPIPSKHSNREITVKNVTIPVRLNRKANDYIVYLEN